jgi:hypothetical protein
VITDRHEQVFAPPRQRGNNLPAADFSDVTRVPHDDSSSDVRNAEAQPFSILAFASLESM